MGYEKMGDILRDAHKNGYGVAALNCFHYESIKYAIDVAEEERVPVIIMMYPSFRSHIPITTFAAITKDLAFKARVPVALHLDHCDSYELLLESIHAGFPSVLIDASHFDYETNVRMTKEVSRAAHAMGCEVEGELGHVGSGSNADDFTDKGKYTDPDQAVDYIREADVDFLAVAIGNGHGKYIVEPKIDVELVKKLRTKVDIPMVMHGGSGIPDDQLAACVRYGVVKYNFGTNFNQAFYDGTVAAINSPEARSSGLWLEGALAPTVKEVLRGHMRAINPDAKHV